jgi:8-oxo-dGTP pyrophosphatase MutT (NUDIX family)
MYLLIDMYAKNNTLLFRKKNNNRDMVCINCNSKKHTYKQCSEPVTSWGIILVTSGNLIKPEHDKAVDLMKTELIESQKRVLIESNNDRLIVSTAYYNIMFLMISRKHSVGYVEFIRGRYKPEKIDQVIYLFKQMKQSEIDKINYSIALEKGFDYLWKDFWGNKYDSSYLSNDYIVSKTNYDMLKVNGVDGPELDLKYIVTTVSAEYDIEEWGFPKGRKKRNETEEQCAIREFKEESGYTDDDFVIIHEIKPLVEEFIGTNGINYKHVYYVAELQGNKIPSNGVTESQKEEVGSVQFMNFITALQCIRDYHVPRKIILEKLFTYYLDKLVIANRHHAKNDKINSTEKYILHPRNGLLDTIPDIHTSYGMGR